MTEKGPEVNVGNINKPVVGERAVSGSSTDGTVDTIYWSPSLATEDALNTMTEAQRQKYQEILDQLKGACGLRDEKQQSSFSDGQKVGALASLATVLATGAGAAAAETVSPSDAKAKSGTEIVSKFEGEIPSKIALDKMTAKASAGTSDVTPAAQPTPIGPEATPSVLDIVTPEYIQETLRMVKDMESPLPVERIKNCLEAWKIREYGKYKQELNSLGLEQESFVECGAKAHYTYENSTWLSTTSSDNFQNYITLDEIDRQLLAGEKETNLKKRAKIMKNFLLDDEGNPVILVVSATDSIGEEAIKKYFKKADQKYKKNGVENFYSGIVDSGAGVYFTAELQLGKGSPAGLLDEWGAINHNISKENSKPIKDFTNQFCRNVPVESDGVGSCQLAKALGLYTVFRSGDGLLTGETVKDMISGETLIATGDEGFVILGNGMFDQAKHYAQKLGVSIDDPWIQRQKEMIYAVYDVVGEDLLTKKK